MGIFDGKPWFFDSLWKKTKKAETKTKTTAKKVTKKVASKTKKAAKKVTKKVKKGKTKK